MGYVVIDNFFDDPIKEREKAMKAEYKDVKHNGLMYRGIAIDDDGPGFEKLKTEIKLEEKITETTCFYRRYLKGYKSETFIHSDVLIGQVSAIAYLTPEKHCTGGLAFWRHKALGWHGHPDNELQKALGIDGNRIFDMIYKDGFEEDMWEMVEYVPVTFNRCVIFSSHEYHSRYPMVPPGDTMEDCRLIKVYFFNHEVPTDTIR